MACYLTGTQGGSGDTGPRRFRITDKHGLTRHAYNLQVDIDLDGQSLSLGLGDSQLPGRAAVAEETAGDVLKPSGQPDQAADDAAQTAEELFDDLASMLRRRADKTIVED